MDNEKLGIDETKHLINFIISLGIAVERALADGKIRFDDMAHFMGAFMSAGEAFKDIKKMPAELKDLDNEELEHLQNYVRERFDLENDRIEALVESAIGLGIQIYQLVMEIRNIIKARKEANAGN